MKKGLLCMLSIILLLVCCPLFASAAQEPEVGINGSRVDMTEGYASGSGWEMVFNREDKTYTLTLLYGNFSQITVRGDLCINIPAGSNVTVSNKTAGTYAIGVTNGTLTFNGTGTLNAVAQYGLYASGGHIVVNSPTLSVSASGDAVYCANSSLTVNGGSLTATGTNYGVRVTGGIYLNGGVLSAVATNTNANAAAAGIYCKNCDLRAKNGTLNVSGFNGIHAYRAQVQLSGAELTGNGTCNGFYAESQSVLQMTDGKSVFTGGENGVFLKDNSVLLADGGQLTAKSADAEKVNTCGIKLNQSDILLHGGEVSASGYVAVNADGLSKNAADEKNSALTADGGVLYAAGNQHGLYVAQASVTVDGGAVNTSCKSGSAVFLSASQFNIKDGFFSAEGGGIGINAYDSHPYITGGTVVADGDSYGIYAIGKITIEGGHVTAVGGNTGIDAHSDLLTTGSTDNAKISLTAIGGSFALAGNKPNVSAEENTGVILFGRTYSYQRHLNYKMLSYVDGTETYRSANACVVRINGDAVDIATELKASGDVLYNNGGSEANYKWKLKNNANNFTLTLNGATLSELEVSGALTVESGATASRITGPVKLNNAYVNFIGKTGSLSFENREGYGIELKNGMLVQREGTLDMGASLYGYAGTVILRGTLFANHRGDTVYSAGGDVYLFNTVMQATDANSLVTANNADLFAFGARMSASSVTETAVATNGGKVLLVNSELQSAGGKGIIADGLQTYNSTVTLRNCTGRGIAVGNGGLSAYHSNISVVSQAESVFARSSVLLDSTALHADSTEGVRAVLLTAPAGSDAAITLRGHCAGAQPVRVSDDYGVSSYFASGDTALSEVVIANEHSYTQTASYVYCNRVGTGLTTCAFPGCGCTRTSILPATEHDFSTYISNDDATCQADGTKTATCPVCFETHTVRDYDSRKEHIFENYVSNNDADCVTDGTKTAVCESCGIETKTLPDEGSRLNHDYKIEIVKGDCQTNVWTRQVCSRCQDASEPQDTGEKGSHIWDETAGCLNFRICTVCGFEDTEKLLGHDFSDFIPSQAATCTEYGNLVATCSRCSAQQKKSDPTRPPLGHIEGNWQVKKNPTAFEEGIEIQICTRCNSLIGNPRVLPRIPQAIEGQTVLTLHTQSGMVTGIPAGMTVAELKALLQNAENVIVGISDTEKLTDDALCRTGAWLSVTESGVKYVLSVSGDVSGDGEVKAEDARLALRCAVKLESFTLMQTFAADTDADGKITAADARTLLRRSVNLE